jgi:hypothetical protein
MKPKHAAAGAANETPSTGAAAMTTPTTAAACKIELQD